MRKDNVKRLRKKNRKQSKHLAYLCGCNCNTNDVSMSVGNCVA